MRLDDDEPLLLDACSAINLEAAFGLQSASSELGRPLLIVDRAAAEVLYLYDVVDGERRRTPIDVVPVVVVELEEEELADFVALTSELGDGEAATIAAAAHRGLPVLTNDRVARRHAASFEPPVVTITTPEVLHDWSIHRSVPAAAVGQVLRAVEQRASFMPPRRSDPYADWWRAFPTL